jgi:hypothetical protein
LPPTGDIASVWTRFTDRANALLWALPLPRRPQILISGLVFHNPPMPLSRVVEILTALERAGLRAVLMGGWGVDALVGRQLRTHRDLDLAVEPEQVDRAVEVLQGVGFERWNADDSPAPLGPVTFSRTESCRDRALRVVDLHGTNLALLGVTDGRVGTREVACFTPEQHLRAQTGRHWTPTGRKRHRKNLAVLNSLIAAKGG